MENQSHTLWSGYDIVASEEDPFFLSKNLSPLDFSDDYHTPLSWQWESMIDQIPLLGSFPTDPLTESFPTCQDDFYIGYEKGFGICDETSSTNEPGKEIVLYNNSNGEGGNDLMKEKKGKRCKEYKNNSSTELTRKNISRYFYMPITQAAKELNVGLTLLKKRCRELGISRWPHRKLMSLHTLIKNIQGLEKEEGEVTEAKLRDAVGILEQERKLMEEIPDMQLEEKTKKLRQACFKANYKKRKLMGMVELDSSPTTTMEAYEQLWGQKKRGKRQIF